MDRANGVLARLDGIDQRLERMERWLERHDAAHIALVDKMHAGYKDLADADAALGERVKGVETALGTRSALGAVGILLTWIASALGISVRQ